mmetsp:Transcript_22267/g.46921  ORF Transcript_22267/g.46921 Transcript_22267/m.46921 type:complete len:259 (+) Transcript_22267:1375-2151(+)
MRGTHRDEGQPDGQQPGLHAGWPYIGAPGLSQKQSRGGRGQPREGRNPASVGRVVRPTGYYRGRRRGRERHRRNRYRGCKSDQQQQPKRQAPAPLQSSITAKQQGRSEQRDIGWIRFQVRVSGSDRYESRRFGRLEEEKTAVAGLGRERLDQPFPPKVSGIGGECHHGDLKALGKIPEILGQTLVQGGRTPVAFAVAGQAAVGPGRGLEPRREVRLGKGERDDGLYGRTERGPWPGQGRLRKDGGLPDPPRHRGQRCL